MFYRFLFSVFMFAALAACGSDVEPLQRLSADAVILAFGDSLTHGTGAKADQSYPARLEELTGRTVINAGIPGELSAAGLERLPRVLDNEEPDLVVLIHGGNDMLRKGSAAALEANLKDMIKEIRSRNIDVIMLGVPNPAIFLSTAEVYERVSSDLGVAIDADIIPDLLGDNSLKSDQIHPNAKGYRRMAEAVKALLEKHKAL